LGLAGPAWWLHSRERIGAAQQAAGLEQEWAAAWAEGQGLSLEQAVTYALQVPESA
jgi:hypothetical protein